MIRWRKSSHSGGEGGNCVEVADTLCQLRDSKNPTGRLLRADVREFVSEVKSGRFDR